MIVSICPKCGGVLEVLVLPTNPPQIKYYCPKCGWTKIERKKIIKLVIEDE